MSDRISQILSLPEAASRPTLAAALANNANCSVTAAKALLQAAPIEKVANDRAAATDDNDPDNPAGVVAMCRRIGLKGFRK